MLHCILGHSASGKTTVQRHLTKSNISQIVTYTTRPKRRKEIDGISYHFLTNKQFENRIEADFFDEVYYIKKKNWYYGLSLKDIDYRNKDYSLVVEPNGYRTLLKKVGKEYMSCYYILLPEHSRIIRMAQRKDDLEEIYRRIHSDKLDFHGFESYADLILTSEDSYANAQAILQNIKEKAL